MIFLAMAGVFVFGWVLVRRHRRKANVEASLRPLAGIDTGVRSVYRVPGRFTHRRGF